jgi:hypothetical protein
MIDVGHRRANVEQGSVEIQANAGVAGIPQRVGRMGAVPCCAVISIAFQRTTSPGPRHWFVLGSRTRPLPHPPSRCSSPVPCVAEGIEVVAGVEGAVAAPTVAGGFRIGAPAATAVAGIASITAIVVTAIESRRPICVLPRRSSTYYNDDSWSVQPRPRGQRTFDCTACNARFCPFRSCGRYGQPLTPMISAAGDTLSNVTLDRHAEPALI